MKQLFLIACIAIIATAGTAQVPSGLVGRWKNQLGSTLTITAINTSTQTITGTYVSPSGGGGTTYPIIGYYNTGTPVSGKDYTVAVSFTVQWGVIGSITAWNGVFRSNNTITAQWLLSRPVSDYTWDHILIGQDTFTKF